MAVTILQSADWPGVEGGHYLYAKLLARRGDRAQALAELARVHARGLNAKARALEREILSASP